MLADQLWQLVDLITWIGAIVWLVLIQMMSLTGGF